MTVPAHRSPPRLRLVPVLRGVGTVVLFAVLAMLLFPATRRSPHRPWQMTCSQRLAQIGLAVRRYAVLHDTYPTAAIVSSEGQPLLSWRVAILPHLGYASLYRRFRLNESWDSPHNLPLLHEIPSVYRCPLHRDLPMTQTSYLGIVGPRAAFVDARLGAANSDLLDPLVSTMIVAESAKVTVPWTKPADWDAENIDRLISPLGIRSHHSNGGFTLFADGKVHLYSEAIPLEAFKATLTRSGRETVTWPIVVESLPAPEEFTEADVPPTTTNSAQPSP